MRLKRPGGDPTAPRTARRGGWHSRPRRKTRHRCRRGDAGVRPPAAGSASALTAILPARPVAFATSKAAPPSVKSPGAPRPSVGSVAGSEVRSIRVAGQRVDLGLSRRRQAVADVEARGQGAAAERRPRTVCGGWPSIDRQPRQRAGGQRHVGGDRVDRREADLPRGVVEKDRAARGVERDLAVLARHLAHRHDLGDLVNQRLPAVLETGDVAAQPVQPADVGVERLHLLQPVVQGPDLGGDRAVRRQPLLLNAVGDLVEARREALCRRQDGTEAGVGIRSARRLDEARFQRILAANERARIVRRAQQPLERGVEIRPAACQPELGIGEPAVAQHPLIDHPGHAGDGDARPGAGKGAGGERDFAPRIAFGHRVGDVVRHELRRPRGRGQPRKGVPE